MVIEKLGSLSNLRPFGLDAVSVAWVEGYIERVRAGLDTGEATNGLVAVLGSYLGEAIIAASDGAWDFDDQNGLGIRFANGDWCFPFIKVEKQFQNGLEAGDSILSFYKAGVDHVATGQLGKAQR